jgi:hypothetical protein
MVPENPGENLESYTEHVFLHRLRWFAVRTVRNTQVHCVGSPYLTGNTSRLRYRAQPVNVVWGNSRCLLGESYRTQRCTVWAVHTSQGTYHVSATEPNSILSSSSPRKPQILYSINWLDSVAETHCVPGEVRTGFLYLRRQLSS